MEPGAELMTMMARCALVTSAIMASLPSSTHAAAEYDVLSQVYSDSDAIGDPQLAVSDPVRELPLLLLLVVVLSIENVRHSRV